MKNLAFNPASVTVAVGTTVTWENQDGMSHNVIADDGSFKSPDLGPGKTFSVTFEKPPSRSLVPTPTPAISTRP